MVERLLVLLIYDFHARGTVCASNDTFEHVTYDWPFTWNGDVDGAPSNEAASLDDHAHAKLLNPSSGPHFKSSPQQSRRAAH